MTSRNMIAILVADDYPIVRKGLKALFKETPDLTVRAEASSEKQVFHCW